MAYVVGGTRFRALRARGAREARFFLFLKQNWILRGVFEVTFVDMTNRLAAMQQKGQNMKYVQFPQNAPLWDLFNACRCPYSSII